MRETGKYEKMMEKYDEYFVPKKNVIHERARFRERKQASGESSESFIRALYELAEHCDFPDKNDQIRHQIVIGLKDKDVSEKLQHRSTLTLEQAIQYARQTELVKTQIQDQTTQFKSLDEVKKYRKQKQSSLPKHFSAKQTHTIARNLSRVIHSVIDVTVDMDRMRDALPGVNAAKLVTSLTIFKFDVKLKIQEQHVKYYMFKI